MSAACGDFVGPYWSNRPSIVKEALCFRVAGSKYYTYNKKIRCCQYQDEFVLFASYNAFVAVYDIPNKIFYRAFCYYSGPTSNHFRIIERFINTRWGAYTTEFIHPARLIEIANKTSPSLEFMRNETKETETKIKEQQHKKNKENARLRYYEDKYGYGGFSIFDDNQKQLYQSIIDDTNLYKYDYAEYYYFYRGYRMYLSEKQINKVFVFNSDRVADVAIGLKDRKHDWSVVADFVNPLLVVVNTGQSWQGIKAEIDAEIKQRKIIDATSKNTENS